MEEKSAYNFTQVDPRRYEWDEDHKFVNTTSKRHGFKDGYSILIEPERCNGAPFNLGCHVLIKDGDRVEADFNLDSLGMQLVAEAIQGIFIEQLAARYVDDEEV